MRDSYDWEDMQPNRFRGEDFAAIGSVRIPYESLIRGDGPTPGMVVDVYKEDRVKRSDNGAQASFYRNGADTECDTEFGLKTFNTFHEAYCAYNRQLLAAAEGMAPPVGRMVLFSHLTSRGRVMLSKLDLGAQETREYVWGYQTALAVMSEHREDTEMYYDAAKDAFMEWVDEQRAEISIPECFDQDVDMIEVDECFEQDWIDEWITNNKPEYDDYKGQIESHQWAHDYEIVLPTEAELVLAMEDGDFELPHGRTVQGVMNTIKNNVWNPMWGVALVEAMRAAPIHNRVHEAFRCLNGEPTGDLHNQNIGEWNGDGVIIDWGYHILGGGANHPTSREDQATPDLGWDYKRNYTDAVCVRAD